MVTGKNNLLELLRQNALMHWKLRNFQRTQLLCESPDDDKLTLSSSLDFLATQLEYLGQGQFNLECWETLGQKKERKSLNFEIPVAITQQHIAAVGSLKDDDNKITDAVQKALAEYKQGVEIQNLKDLNKMQVLKIAELQNEIDSSTNRILNRVEPYLGQIMEIAGFKTPTAVKSAAAVSGADQQKIDADQERLEIAFDKWMNKETEVLTIIEKIAEMANSEPGTYAMARSMLIK